MSAPRLRREEKQAQRGRRGRSRLRLGVLLVIGSRLLRNLGVSVFTFCLSSPLPISSGHEVSLPVTGARGPETGPVPSAGVEVRLLTACVTERLWRTRPASEERSGVASGRGARRRQGRAGKAWEGR